MDDGFMGLTTEEEILHSLQKKDPIIIPDFSKSSPLVQFLWTLEIVKDNTETKRITAKAASNIFYQLTEINLKEEAIVRALARAGNKIKPHQEDKKKYYEITNQGRKFVESNITNISADRTFFFTGKSSWSDLNKNFPKLIEILEGDLCVVDPYYGLGTFNVLGKFGKKRKLRFLSGELGRKEQSDLTNFGIELKRFKNEFKNIKMRKYEKYYEIHDRYIIAKNGLVVIGHGIKDLGDKESFVIFLPSDIVGDLLHSLKQIFEERWGKSQNIS